MFFLEYLQCTGLLNSIDIHVKIGIDSLFKKIGTFQQST